MIPQNSYRDYPILFVDNNTEELQTYSKKLGNFFSVLIANSTDSAFNILNNTPHLAVVLSGQDLHHFSGTEFLNKIYELFPDVIRMILTAESDFKIASDAINQGSIYKYIIKPCKYDLLKIELMRAIEKFILESEQKFLLEERIGLEKLTTIGELASGFAHEVRNPVAIISLNAEIVISRLSDQSIQCEKVKGSLNEILNQCQRLSMASSQLLNFARPNSATFEYIELDNLIERSIYLIRQEMDFDNIDIIKEIQIDLPELYGDRIQLEHVFINLLRNSHHSMQGKGTIYLKCKMNPKGKEIEIVHKDNGEYVTRDDFMFILNQFFDHKQDVTGLGLYTIHRIIHSLGGKMIVDEDNGGGSLIRINLPVRSGEGLNYKTANVE